MENPQGISLFTKYSTGLTLEKAFSSPSISKAKKELQNGLGVGISQVIAFYNNQLNLPRDKKMNIDQILTLTHELISTYWYWKFDEFVLVLRMGISGEFGKLFQVFDGNTVKEWFKVHDLRRDSLLIGAAAEEAASHRYQEEKILEGEVSDIYLDLLRSVLSGTRDKLSQQEQYDNYREEYFSKRRGQ